MIKKLFFFFCIMLLASCSYDSPCTLCGQGCDSGCYDEVEQTPRTCPLVYLRDTAYTQLVQHKDAFQVTLVGYNGHCHLDIRNNRSQAVVEPIFIIRRLSATDETNVPFAFYTSTEYGPDSHRRYQVYYEVATIPEFEKEIRYIGKKAQVRLPQDLLFSYGINLGLVIKPREQIYNNRYFDNHFDYSEDK